MNYIFVICTRNNFLPGDVIFISLSERYSFQNSHTYPRVLSLLNLPYWLQDSPNERNESKCTTEQLSFAGYGLVIFSMSCFCFSRYWRHHAIKTLFLNLSFDSIYGWSFCSRYCTCFVCTTWAPADTYRIHNIPFTNTHLSVHKHRHIIHIHTYTQTYIQT